MPAGRAQAAVLSPDSSIRRSRRRGALRRPGTQAGPAEVLATTAQCSPPAETFGAAANNPNRAAAAEKRRKKDAQSVPAASCVRRQRRPEGRLGEAVSRRPAHRVGAGRRLGPETARPIVLVGGPAGPPPARRRQPSHAVLGPLQPSRRPSSLGRRRRLASGRQPSCLPRRTSPRLRRSGIRRSPAGGWSCGGCSCAAGVLLYHMIYCLSVNQDKLKLSKGGNFCFGTDS